jgi:hypothetical protein
MMGPRIELLGIQLRRAENAHQGALLVHGASSVACDTPRPLTHVKAYPAVCGQTTTVSMPSNKGATSGARADSACLAHRQTANTLAASLEKRLAYAAGVMEFMQP